jgi:Ribonuclease G/E
MEVIITKSSNKNKKFDALVDGKKISFGAAMYSDYTIHKDPERKERYIARHAKREDWDKSGIKTSGYWAKNLLWNKDTLQKSIDDISKKHNLNIKIK